jgi:2-C-methyl-D-erythritol 4-phosphate cytidylyltransferase
MMNETKAVILASGSGLRFQDRQPKQFMKLAGLPVLVHTLKTFQSSASIDGIVVVSHEDYVDHVWDLVNRYGLCKVEKVVAGGRTRQESSRIGIQCCGDQTDYVLIHDSVRPFLSHKVIEDLVKAVRVHGAVDTVIPSADTLVEVDPEGFIQNIPNRSRFRRGQTPQAFAYSLILDAHRRALADGIDNATDDCFLVLRLGQPVFTVEGHEQNIKITYPLDLHLADKLFQLKAQTLPAWEGAPPELEGKVFVVIGGTSGIGQALCEQLERVSSRVYCFSRSTAIAVDVRHTESIQAAVEYVLEKEGEIDFVVNCSGDLIRKSVEFTSAEEWQHIYDTNINGNFYLAKSLIPVFKRQNRGNLLFIGSSSYTRGRGGYAAYSSSKAALVNFCQALSEEVEDYNIRVNLVSPGRVRTPLRFRNFGHENPETLLNAERVARQILHALAAQTTGSVFEVQS